MRSGRSTAAARGRRDDARHEQSEDGTCDRAREHAGDPDDDRADADDPAQERRRRALGLEVVEVAAVVAQVGEDGEREAERASRRATAAAASSATSVPCPSGSSWASSRRAWRETASTPLKGGCASAAIAAAVPAAACRSRPRSSDPRRGRGSRSRYAGCRLRRHGVPARAGEVVDDRSDPDGDTAAADLEGSVPPGPPARTPRRGVTRTAGGVTSVACRTRRRASFCCEMRKSRSTPPCLGARAHDSAFVRPTPARRDPGWRRRCPASGRPESAPRSTSRGGTSSSATSLPPRSRVGTDSVDAGDGRAGASEPRSSEARVPVLRRDHGTERHTCSPRPASKAKPGAERRCPGARAPAGGATAATSDARERSENPVPPAVQPGDLPPTGGRGRVIPLIPSALPGARPEHAGRGRPADPPCERRRSAASGAASRTGTRDFRSSRTTKSSGTANEAWSPSARTSVAR